MYLKISFESGYWGIIYTPPYNQTVLKHLVKEGLEN